MPKWLIETVAQLLVWLLALGLACVFTLAFAWATLGNGGAVTGTPFNAGFQIVITLIWGCGLAGLFFGARRLSKCMG